MGLVGGRGEGRGVKRIGECKGNEKGEGGGGG